MSGLQTEFEFTLPKGYVGDQGELHRDGIMRLATARDEIEPLRDRSIDGPDDPYLTILVLARVITRLGGLEDITVDEVEGLFAADLAFLQDLYGIINFGDPADVAALQASVLPDPRVDDEVVDNADADNDNDNGADAIDDVADGDPIDGEAVDTSSRGGRRARIEEIAH